MITHPDVASTVRVLRLGDPGAVSDAPDRPASDPVCLGVAPRTDRAHDLFLRDSRGVWVGDSPTVQ